MSFSDSAKRVVGKMLKPVHAGDDKLLTHQKELCGSSDRMPRRIEVHSDAFSDDGTIPVRYSGEGENVSPPLRWSGVPEEARELVLICEDPDAPMPKPYLHWIMAGIEPQVDELPEALSKERKPDELEGAVQGDNGSSRAGYTGPIPPKGHGTHHYHFELFALDQPLKVDEAPDREALMKAMAGHVVAYGEVVGTYERK
jgi:Raf kinase inhibitor-like YbhB/YbcL family protein